MGLRGKEKGGQDLELVDFIFEFYLIFKQEIFLFFIIVKGGSFYSLFDKVIKY